MISVIVLAIIALALTAIAGFSVFSIYQSSLVVNDAQRNRVEMLTIAKIIESNARSASSDGFLYAPQGSVSSEGYTTIPGWLKASAKTPWGTSYGYCAYAPNNTIATGADANIEGDLSTYPIDVTNNALTGNRNYVTGSEAPPIDGILALIISSEPNSQVTPNCSDVTFTNGKFKVSGGVVSAVHTNKPLYQRIATSNHDIAYDQASDATLTLESVLNTWHNYLPDHISLTMTAGDKPLPAQMASLATNPLETVAHKSIRLTGAGAGSTNITLPASVTEIDFDIPGITLSLKDLKVADGISLKIRNGTAILDSVILPSLYLENADVILLGGTQINTVSGGNSYALSSLNSKVTLEGATVSISGQNGDPGALYLSGGSLNLDASSTISHSADLDAITITLDNKSELNVIGGGLTQSQAALNTPGSLLKVGPNATASLDSASLTISDSVDTLISNRGVLTLTNSVISAPSGATVGIRLKEGSRTTLEGGTTIGLSAPSAISQVIEDTGAVLVSGSSAEVYGLDCWNEGSASSLFQSSLDQNNASSTPQAGADKAVVLLNRSNWTCKR